MKVIRAVIWTLIMLVLLSGIGTSLNLILHPHPPRQAWKQTAETTWTDRDERSHLIRASRAGSRSAVVSASTTTTLPQTITPPTTLRKPRPPQPTTTVQNTEQLTSAENPPGEISSNYDTCLAAAASVKGAKVAPNVARWTHLVEKYFPNEIYKTCRVMACESGGNPGAVGPRQPNGTYPHGLMQILSGPFDPEENVALAASMRARRGWQPWACK